MPLETLARQDSSSRVFPSQCNVTTLLHSRAPCRVYSLPSVTRKQPGDAKDTTTIHLIIIIIITIIIIIILIIIIIIIIIVIIIIIIIIIVSGYLYRIFSEHF